MASLLLALAPCLLSATGIGYMMFAAHAVRRLARTAGPPPAPLEPVSLLKPLHGAEPRLADNLATFLDQHWPAPIEMVTGVSDPRDPALAVAQRLEARTAIAAARHGANAKVSNLINMMPSASYDMIVLSDSDMAVPPDYLATLAAWLAVPGTGAVTCLYRGRGDAGFWSVLAAANLSYGFLPNVIVSLSLGAGAACMGSTIALRRETLAAIGGFEAFADILADDHAIGMAVRRLGLEVRVPPMVLVHACSEASMAALVRHELRWAATIRALRPWGYAGSIVTFPLPLALLAIPFAPLAGLALSAAALAVRAFLARRIDRFAGAPTAPLWLLPMRDTLSFLLFVASFFVRSVDWRGSRLRMESGGRIAAGAETDSR